MLDKSNVVRGGVWAAASTLLAMASALLSAAAVTRLLAPFEVGIYFASLAAVGLGALVGSLGLSTPITAFIATTSESDSGARRQIVVRGFLASAAGAVAVSLVFLFGVTEITRAFTGGREEIAWLLLASLTTVFIFRQVTVYSLTALARFRDAAVVRGVPSTLAAVILSVLWLRGVTIGVEEALAIVAVGHLGALVLGAGFLAVQLRGTRASHRPPPFRRYLAIGLPWLGTSLLIFVFVQAGALITAMVSSPEEAALYGSAFRLASLVAVPTGIVGAVLPPLVVRFWATNDRIALEKLMRAAATVAGSIAVAITVALVVGGKSLLAVAFGQFYGSAWATLIVLCIGFTVDAVTGRSGQMLALVGKERSVLYVFLVATPSAVVAMAVLGQLYGSVGVALGSASVLVASNIVLAVVSWRTIGVRTWASASMSDIRATGIGIYQGLRNKGT